MTKSFLFVITCIISLAVHAQKKFDVIISFADTTISNNIAITFDDGENKKTIRGEEFPDGNIHISGHYMSDFAALEIGYLDAPEYYSGDFFVKNKAARISFLKPDIRKNMFKTYELDNAYDFQPEKKRMEKYDAQERATLDTFTMHNGEKIFNGEQPYYDRFWQLHNAMYRKDFEFICSDSASYYALWYYKNKIAQSGCVGADTLLKNYHSIFPEDLRGSYDGQRLEQLLYGRVNTVKGGNAPDFNSVDIKGNVISKNRFLNSKYVLLHFWATWCVPCMKEMDQITTIRNKYKNDFIEIVAVDFDRDSTAFITETKKGKMEWIHIYRDMNLYYMFGNRPSIPQVYLIDKDGMIVYSREEEKDYHLDKLQEMLTTIYKEQMRLTSKPQFSN